MDRFEIRPADAADIDALATLWHDGWLDAHAELVPASLAALRTLASLRDRLVAALVDTFVIGPRGAPLGMYMLKRDELNQLYVGAPARGTGAAIALIEDAEQRLARAGHSVGWLACAIGNTRAARFYDKRGWELRRTETIDLDTPAGKYPLEIWRYEKRLAR